jgi:hypothetical protein
MRRVPRPVLHIDFVSAVRASGTGLATLASLAGYPAHTPVSALLIHRTIAPTPLALQRVESLARLVNYDGPLFEETAS